MDSPSPHEIARGPQEVGLGASVGVEGEGERVEVPLVPATEEQVIAALGRVFLSVCALAERG